MTFNPSDYIRDRGFDDISNSAAAGDTRVENAILYGNANLLKAADEAKFLRDSAKATGSAMRFAGQQAGNASMFGGAMSGLSSLAFGAYKGGHFGGKTEFSQPVPGNPGARETIGGYGGNEYFTPSEVPGFTKPDFSLNTPRDVVKYPYK